MTLFITWINAACPLFSPVSLWIIFSFSHFLLSKNLSIPSSITQPLLLVLPRVSQCATIPGLLVVTRPMCQHSEWIPADSHGALKGVTPPTHTHAHTDTITHTQPCYYRKSRVIGLYDHNHVLRHKLLPVRLASILHCYSASALTWLRPPRRISGADTGLTQRWHRSCILLPTWLKIWRITAFETSLCFCLSEFKCILVLSSYYKAERVTYISVWAAATVVPYT